jgi:CRP/FNR family transcriptional regulator
MSGFSDAHIDALLAVGRLERLTRGRTLAFDGGEAVVVVAGWLRVFRDTAAMRDVTLGLAHRGALLAGNALFGERTAETGALALGPAICAHLDRQAFATAMEREPSLLLAAARVLAKRTGSVQAKLERLSRAPAEARVAATLRDLAAVVGQPLPGGAIRLELPLSQGDLADVAGTTRATASATLTAFVRQGLLLGTRPTDLTILDPAALEAAAEALIGTH